MCVNSIESRLDKNVREFIPLSFQACSREKTSDELRRIKWHCPGALGRSSLAQSKVKASNENVV